MSYEIHAAEVGQLWELNLYWSHVMGHSEAQTYLLVRRVGDTNVWDALCIETQSIESLTLSSLLYERVA